MNVNVIIASLLIWHTEVENIVNITASTEFPVAGEYFSLTCTITSERNVNVSWVDPWGVPCPTDGTNYDINVFSHPDRGRLITYSWLEFPSIRTSMSGTYTCISSIANPSSQQEAVYSVQIQSEY